jgi:hypothetical protein
MQEQRRFGKGWKRDSAENAAKRPLAHQLFGGSMRLAPQGSLLDVTPAIRDQGQTESCFGFASWRAIDTRLRKLAKLAGQPLTTVTPHSPLGIYAFTRMGDMPDATSPLGDVGSQPSTGVAMMQKFGVPTEQAWPFDPNKVNVRPPVDVLEKAGGFVLQDLYRINATGDDLIAAIAASISAGYPVIFGADVDQAFEDYNGSGQIVQSAAQTLGGHMLTALAYDFSSKTKNIVGGNSWGTTWGNAGFFNMNPSFLTDPRTSDFYVVVVRHQNAKPQMSPPSKAASKDAPKPTPKATPVALPALPQDEPQPKGKTS